jgi:hypothetical protein
VIGTTWSKGADRNRGIPQFVGVNVEARPGGARPIPAAAESGLEPWKVGRLEGLRFQKDWPDLGGERLKGRLQWLRVHRGRPIATGQFESAETAC